MVAYRVTYKGPEKNYYSMWYWNVIDAIVNAKLLRERYPNESRQIYVEAKPYESLKELRQSLT